MLQLCFDGEIVTFYELFFNAVIVGEVNRKQGKFTSEKVCIPLEIYFRVKTPFPLLIRSFFNLHHVGTNRIPRSLLVNDIKKS